MKDLQGKAPRGARGGGDEMIVRRTMGHHRDIKLDDKIVPMRTGLKRQNVLERINKALKEPGKIFEPPEHRLAQRLELPGNWRAIGR